MADLALQNTEELLAAAYSVCQDGERRWDDLDIAKALGFEQPINIRKLVRAHAERLQRHGILSTVEIIHEGAGRPGIGYRLNYEQALLICTVSETPLAHDVCEAIIKVAARAGQGNLATAPRMDLRELEVVVQTAIAPIVERLDKIEYGFNRGRKDFTKATWDKHIACIQEHYAGRCPCCKRTIIVKNGQKLAGCQAEHYQGRHLNSLEDTWITCESCNQRLRHPEFHNKHISDFLSYQNSLKAFNEEHDPQQLNFFLT